MARVPDQISLKAAWKENLYSLLVVAIIAGASILLFFEASDIRGPTSAIHTHQAAVASPSQR